MEALGHLLQGFAAALTPGYLLYAFVGCMLGTLIGVLPGLGPAAGTAILIPLTFSLDATGAIIIGILLNLAVVYLCLRNLGFLERLLGPVGIAVVRKVFGFILLAIAVKIFRTHAGL